MVRRVIHDCAPGEPYYELFGGEPLLHPRVDEVIELIGQTGSVLGIPTNGTVVDRHVEALVGEAPIRLWISLDGPEEINDRQRGAGVFRKALAGLDLVHAARAERGSAFPQLGVTCIVTPLNCDHIERFFLDSLDLSKLDFISIVLQNFATREECDAYESIVRERFGGSSAPCARGYQQDPRNFAAMDLDGLARQIRTVKEACREKDVLYFSNPMTLDTPNLEHFFAARWDRLTDRRSRCAFPWMYAEISARGDVTTCHTFYDVTVGNVYDRDILEIWNGEEIRKVREHLRCGLYPICTACCRYYNNPTSRLRERMEMGK